jgi:hypothetical protein
MNATPSATSQPRLGRSIWAVVAGFLAVFILSTAVDAVLHATHVYPPMGQAMSDSLFVLATAYRTLFTILGGYITARLAPNRPMRHAIILGIVGMIAGTIGLVAFWNKGPEFGPHWYPIALVVEAIPCTWLGAKLSGKA